MYIIKNKESMFPAYNAKHYSFVNSCPNFMRQRIYAGKKNTTHNGGVFSNLRPINTNTKLCKYAYTFSLINF